LRGGEGRKGDFPQIICLFFIGRSEFNAQLGERFNLSRGGRSDT